MEKEKQMDEPVFNALIAAINENFDFRFKSDMYLGELTLFVPASHLVTLCLFLHHDHRFLFKQCSDICGVDYPDRTPRFDVVYHLLSLKHNLRLRLKVATDENTPVPSVISIWPAANWYEREVWDMYGILFSDHPDLRRILTDYGFEGHPQRKDFPLTGFYELRYDLNQSRIVSEPVKLVQDFRDFDFQSPWEAITPKNPEDILPGDEKADAPPPSSGEK